MTKPTTPNPWDYKTGHSCMCPASVHQRHLAGEKVEPHKKPGPKFRLAKMPTNVFLPGSRRGGAA